MKENLNIDELLNAFVDEELNVRQQTEVKRLVDHDPNIAERLEEIKRYKRLLNSLPGEQVPEHMFEDIRAAVERQTLLSEPAGHFEHQKGAVQLMFRKVLSAAAMIALLAGLGLVILNVVMPKQDSDKEFAENIQSPAIVDEVSRSAVEDKPVPTDVVFNGRLELRTEDFGRAESFISEVIADSGIGGGVVVSQPHSWQKSFNVSCNQEELKSILSELSKGWYQFDSARLVVASAEQSLAVNGVSAEQIIRIAEQNDLAMQLKAAKYYAFINNMRQPSTEQILTAKDAGKGQMDIPQPTLTSSRRAATKGDTKQIERKAQLIIILREGL